MSKTPSSATIKNYYSTTAFNTNCNSNANGNAKRQIHMNDNGCKARYSKLPRSDNSPDIVELSEESEDENVLTNEFLPGRGVSTPAPGALPFGMEETFNAPEDPSKSKLHKIYFLSSSKDLEQMKSVMHYISRESFYPRWIDAKDVETMVAQEKKQPTLVLDSFESTEFVQLKSIKRLLILSAYALLAINPKKYENIVKYHCMKHHLASICMHGIRVTVSGVDDYDLRHEIRRKVRYMGGEFLAGLHKNTNHVLSNRWDTPKCKMARILGLKVMTPQWILRCWELREDKEEIEKISPNYRLPPFANMNICLTGFDANTRTTLKRIIQTNGGNYHAGLIYNKYEFDGEETQRINEAKAETARAATTHLVVNSRTGEKYKYAMGVSNIFIVNADWVRISAAAGYPQAENDSKYCERDPNALDDLLRQERERKRKELQSCTQEPNPAFEKPGISSQYSLATSTPKADALAEIEKLLSSTVISCNNVFDGLCFYFCGFPSNIQSNSKRLISRLGGTVYPELVTAVTHVIIGPHMTSKEALNINRHHEEKKSIAKVCMDWIIRCAHERELITEFIDPESENLLGQMNSTQDLPPAEAMQIARARALAGSDKFVKAVVELEANSVLNNKNNNNNPNEQNGGRSGLRLGATIPTSPASKIKITRRTSRQSEPGPSIPVGWQSTQN